MIFKRSSPRRHGAGAFEPLDRVSGGLADWPAGTARMPTARTFTTTLPGGLAKTSSRNSHGARPGASRTSARPRSGPYTARRSAACGETSRRDLAAQARRAGRRCRAVPGAPYAPRRPGVRTSLRPRRQHRLFQARRARLSIARPHVARRRRSAQCWPRAMAETRSAWVTMPVTSISSRSGRASRSRVTCTGSPAHGAVTAPHGRGTAHGCGRLAGWQARAAVHLSGGARTLVVIDRKQLEAGRGALDKVALEPTIERPLVFASPRWSPDGRYVAVERRARDGPSQIVVVDPDTRGQKVVATSASGRNVRRRGHPTAARCCLLPIDPAAPSTCIE